MKLTKTKLKQLIKEELEQVLERSSDADTAAGGVRTGFERLNDIHTELLRIRKRLATREPLAIRKLLEKLPGNIAAALVGLQGQSAGPPAGLGPLETD